MGLGILDAPLSLAEAFRLTLPSWVVLVALVPAIVGVADRAAEVRPLATRAALHAVAAVGFATLHLTGSAALGEVVLTASPGFGRHLSQLASVYFVADLLTYGALVGLHGELRRARRERAGELAAARVEAGHAEAEASVLRAHLNPDFLFNALNAVSGLVARGETRDSLDALSWLGRLIRASTAAGRADPPTLGGEIDRVDGYFRIQEARFRPRFRAHVDLPSRAAAWPCPPLALYEGVVSLIESGLGRGDVVSVTLHAPGDEATGIGPPPDDFLYLDATFGNRRPPSVSETGADGVVERMRLRLDTDVTLCASLRDEALTIRIGVPLPRPGTGGR